MRSKIVLERRRRAIVIISKNKFAQNVVSGNVAERIVSYGRQRDARMLGKSFLHAYVSVRSPSQADLVVYRL